MSFNSDPTSEFCFSSTITSNILISKEKTKNQTENSENTNSDRKICESSLDLARNITLI